MTTGSNTTLYYNEYPHIIDRIFIYAPDAYYLAILHDDSFLVQHKSPEEKLYGSQLDKFLARCVVDFVNALLNNRHALELALSNKYLRHMSRFFKHCENAFSHVFRREPEDYRPTGNRFGATNSILLKYVFEMVAPIVNNVDFSHLNVGIEELQILGPSMMDLSSLLYLDFSHNILDSTSACIIASCINSTPLSCLNLEGCQLGNSGIGIISRALPRTIMELNLSANDFDGYAMINLSSALSKICNLRVLKLNDNKLGNVVREVKKRYFRTENTQITGIQLLTDSHINDIELLELRNNNIGPDDAELLCKIVGHHIDTDNWVIDVIGNQFGFRGVEAAIKVLVKCDHNGPCFCIDRAALSDNEWDILRGKYPETFLRLRNGKTYLELLR